MKYIADLHIHSKYSRATSPKMDLEGLSSWAKIKGIDVVATGDFTHPAWISELSKKLKPAEEGFYKYNGVLFVLSVEISSIYSKGGKVRKIHNLVYAPSLEIAEKINFELNKIGNLTADGRPILGLDAEKLAEIVFNISKYCVIVPAHAWTPWFSIFGSKSGFDTIEECFGKYTKMIFAIETGLSSDPAMNWRLSMLDNVSLISCSDAHSPAKLGREVCVFDTELSYNAMFSAIRHKDPAKFLFTVEFFPEEGKYHYDGHRNCKIRWEPKETKAKNKLCSVCQRPVTVGVMHRVDDLADRDDGFKPKQAIPYKSLIPLQEIIAEAKGRGVNTKTVQSEYMKVVEWGRSEFRVLLEISEDELRNNLDPKVAEGIIKVRQGEVNIAPGYDGEFGTIKLFESNEAKTPQNLQLTL
ncbi:MAG: endonuclease Q family protein [Candidatus Margulisbacteria bacterium]|nr:endonuclease Q family protein [Candidatus Margulisiibacteriota bacterium]